MVFQSMMRTTANKKGTITFAQSELVHIEWIITEWLAIVAGGVLDKTHFQLSHHHLSSNN